MMKIIFLALLIISTFCVEPGLKVTISQQTLTYVTNQIVPEVQRQITFIDIPDVSEEIDTPIGSLLLSISQIKIQYLKLTSANLQVQDGLQVAVKGCEAAVKLNWKYRKSSWPHLTGEGTADVTINLDASLLIQIGVTPDEKPLISIKNVNAKVVSLNLKLHGGASWLFNFVLKIFNKAVKNAVESAIQAALSKTVAESVQKVVESIPVKIPIRDGIFVDMGFKQITIRPNVFMLSGNSGEVVYSSGTRYPGKRQVLPDYEPKYASKMLQITLSEYVLNSASFAAIQTEPSRIMINSSLSPAILTPLMNTNVFRLFIPKIYEMYPDVPFRVIAEADGAPLIRISNTTKCEVVAAGHLKFELLVPNKPIVTAFVFVTELVMLADVEVNPSKVITADMQLKSCVSKIKDSIVGDFDIGPVGEIISTLLKFGVVPVINKYAKDGIPIPSVQGVVLRDTQVYYENSYLRVVSDFDFTPPKQMFK